MRKHGIFMFVAGLAALAGIGFAGSAISATHGPGAASPGQAGASNGASQDAMLLMPVMNPARGRKLYASKGCVVCHAVNGVGGEDAPPLDAATMPKVMNPFDFAAKMWRGAGVMIALQEDELGGQIEFTGNELADIIAFVHSVEEQKKFTAADIPARVRRLMKRADEEGEGHGEEETGTGKPKK